MASPPRSTSSRGICRSRPSEMRLVGLIDDLLDAMDADERLRFTLDVGPWEIRTIQLRPSPAE
jgi:hypothetical protein